MNKFTAFFRNWKSTTAFFVFVGVYIFTIYNDKSVDIISVAGYLALYAMVMMVLRSELTATLIEKLIDKLPTRK